MQTQKPKETDREPSISELEETFRIFKDAHGHSSLMNTITEIRHRLLPKKIIPRELNEEEEKIYNTEKKLKVKKVKPAKQHSNYFKFFYDTRDCFLIFLEISRKTFSFIRSKMKMKKYRYSTMVLGLFLGIFFLFNLPTIYTRFSWNGSGNKSQSVIVRTKELVKRPMADSAPLAHGEVIPSESRLVVPKINVNVPIVFANSTDEKKIQEDLHGGVVHYDGTAMPGEVGNSFITGHSSNYWWDTGKYNYAFVLLDKLEAGDKAVVYYNSKKFIYTVRSKNVVNPKDTKILAPTTTPVLTLMTCTPPGTSWQRLVVKLDRTDPVFYKPATVTREKVIHLNPVKNNVSLWEKITSFFKPN